MFPRFFSHASGKFGDTTLYLRVESDCTYLVYRDKQGKVQEKKAPSFPLASCLDSVSRGHWVEWVFEE